MNPPIEKATPDDIAEALADQLARAHERTYQEAKPFPHAILDGLLEEPDAAAAARVFPPANWPDWRLHLNRNTKKRDCADLDKVPPLIRKLLLALNGGQVIYELRRLTGIPALLPDPTLEGGGMHRIDAGGFLGIHRDFNVTPDRRLLRRVNLLLYLNACQGGDLELWEEEAGKPARRASSIEPSPGRAVVFTTTGPAWHGHPHPLRSAARLSLAAYYYTVAPANTTRHLTIYAGEK